MNIRLHTIWANCCLEFTLTTVLVTVLHIVTPKDLGKKGQALQHLVAVATCPSLPAVCVQSAILVAQLHSKLGKRLDGATTLSGYSCYMLQCLLFLFLLKLCCIPKGTVCYAYAEQSGLWYVEGLESAIIHWSTNLFNWRVNRALVTAQLVLSCMKRLGLSSWESRWLELRLFSLVRVCCIYLGGNWSSTRVLGVGKHPSDAVQWPL